MKNRKTFQQYIRLVVLLLALVPAAFADAGDKSEKERLNKEFGDIAKQMQEFYDSGNMDEVLDRFRTHCIKGEEMGPKPKAGKKRRLFKKISREIRSNIYRLAASSYFESGNPGMGDIYLKKLNKSQLNEAFRIIAREMEKSFEDGQSNDVIDQYEENCCKRYNEDDKKAKLPKEKKLFNRVEEDIRADIYRLVALSYDDLNETEMRDIYLKKLLDIRLYLESDSYRESWRKIVEKKYVVAPKWLLGLKYGINFTFAKDIDDSARGTQPGIILEYAFKRNLLLSIQTAYINLGLVGESSKKLVYAEIPVLIKYHFLKGKLKPYLQTGLFYHYLMAADIEDEEGKIRQSNWGFWVGAGIGLDIKIKSIWFRPGIEVNYKHGFIDILEGDIKIRNVEISVKLLASIYRKVFRR